VKVQRTGDWTAARQALFGSAGQLRGAISSSLQEEADALKKDIHRGLTQQAPGGKPLTPLSPLTRALRKQHGDRALIRRGELLRSIAVVARGNKVFVGISRKARTRGGRSMAEIARVHEFGAGPFIVKMTPAMRRFLFASMRDAGIPPRRSRAGGRGVVVIKIPARPFLRPAFEDFRRHARQRVAKRIIKYMRWET